MSRFARCFLAVASPAVAVVFTLHAAGPGTVNFNNSLRIVGLDAPVLHVDCQTRLGAAYRAQLFAGPSDQQMMPVGEALPFRDKNGIGTGYVNGGVVDIPSVPAGNVACVQMWAWGPIEPQGEVSPPPRWRGHSKVFTVVTGGDTGNGPPNLPADLVGLESFCLEEVKSAPFFISNPTNGVVYPGQSFEFTAEVQSVEPVTYQWRLNGTDIPGAVQSKLTIPIVRPEHLGDYQVVASNATGATASSIARLVFWPPPDGATLNCSNFDPSVGLDAPVFDTDCTTRLAGDMFAAQLYVGRTSDQLKAINGGGYGFRERPGYWSGPLPEWLQLDRQPGLAELHLQPGEDVFVQVRVWDVSGGSASFEEAVLAGAKHGRSKVLQVTTGGAGNPPAYPASLSGLESFCLEQVPVIVTQPVGVVVPLGHPFILEVQVASATPVSYQWQLNGKDIASATQATLSLSAAGVEHSGLYRVVVSNATGSATSASARVQLRELPAGALLYFSNFAPQAAVDAPVFDGESQEKLAGPAFLAQLYAGPTADLLASIDRPRPFLVGSDAGYWGTPEDAWVTVPTVVPGAMAYAQVRVWESKGGWHFEEAVSRGVKAGVSEVLPVTTGGGANIVAWPALRGLGSFQITRAPVFTTQPESGTVEVGGTVTLRSQTDSAVGVAFQWYFDGEEIPSATAQNLTLRGVTSADQGTYVVIARNGAGSVTSAAARLEVSGAVQSEGTVYFSNRVPLAGVDAPVFASDGVTPLAGVAYLAQLLGGPAADQMRPLGEPARFRDGGYWSAATSVLNIPGVKPGDTAFLQVRAWEATAAGGFVTAVAGGAAFGSSEVFAVVTGGAGSPPGFPADMVGLKSFILNPALRIQAQPAGGWFFVGENARLELQVQGAGPVNYQWRRNGEAIPGGTNPVLELKNLRLDDAGYYSVRVADSLRAIVSANAEVAVFPLPNGASVLFSNFVPEAGVDAPIFEADLNPVNRPEVLAQLWVGTTAETLAPLGAPVHFVAGARGGYLDVSAPGAMVIPGIAPGTKVMVQIRVWDSGVGATFEEALAARGPVGRSEVIEVVTGGLGAPDPSPAPLKGLKSFALSTPPVITSSPRPLTVGAGQPALLQVGFATGEPVSVQWFFNDRAIPGATGTELQIAAAKKADEGIYQAILQNWAGTTKSARVRLNVLTSGGLLSWTTRDPARGVDAPVYDADGRTRLSGSRYRAQLLAGVTAESLVVVGSGGYFGTGGYAGYISGDQISLPNIPPGGRVFLQMRVWDSAYGATFDQAKAVGRIGESEVFEMLAGGGTAPPAALVGLKSFSLGAGIPLVIGQPQDTWVLLGEPLRLTVIGTNYTSIHWEHLTGDVWVSVPGAVTAAIEFTPVAIEDGGQFRAVLQNSGGAIAMSTSATVYVGRKLRAGNQSLSFALQVSEGSGPVFTIEGSTDLKHWNQLIQVTNSTTTIELAESEAARQSPTRYYRARSASSGKVASTAIEGVIDVELLPGASFVGFPLLAANRAIASLFAGAPEGAMFYKYNRDGSGFGITTFDGGEWVGSNPEERLELGEGVVVINPSDDLYVVSLRGSVPVGEMSTQLPAEWSLVAPGAPIQGRLLEDLKCPMASLDIVAKWNVRQAVLDLFVYAYGVWWDPEGRRLPMGPTIMPGEACWIWKGKAAEWNYSCEPGS